VKEFGKFRDVKLFPEGAKEWDWRKTKTHHSPGIQPTDVAKLIPLDAKTVLFSRNA
jgi:hypothetical protein